MTKEEIYHDFCKKVQSGEYKISQVTRSNSPVLGKQEFNFTLEKLYTAEDIDRASGVWSDLRIHARGKKFTKEEFDEIANMRRELLAKLDKERRDD